MKILRQLIMIGLVGSLVGSALYITSSVALNPSVRGGVVGSHVSSRQVVIGTKVRGGKMFNVVRVTNPATQRSRIILVPIAASALR